MKQLSFFIIKSRLTFQFRGSCSEKFFSDSYRKSPQLGSFLYQSCNRQQKVLKFVFTQIPILQSFSKYFFSGTPVKDCFSKYSLSLKQGIGKSVTGLFASGL